MVNIFIIVPDIKQTAKMLDMKRLGKQRVEAKQIIDLLEFYDKNKTFNGKSWSNHPATLSWIGFTNHLKVYFNIITREWIERGYNNTMEFYNVDESLYNIVPCTFENNILTYDNTMFNEYSFPFWVSFPPFYLSHQAALCRKNPTFYKFLLREELKPFLEVGYLWPSHLRNENYANWSPQVHDPIATGCPPVFRIKTLHVLEWMKHPLINPSSKRAITPKSQIYKDFIDAMKNHKIEVKDNFHVYVKGGYLCDIRDLDTGIILLNNYYNQNGGYPSIGKIVYEFANVEY